jgi:aromatic-amino-acid transaminase
MKNRLSLNFSKTLSAFDALEPQPADALLMLIGMHSFDPRAEKIDLGVGVYRDNLGGTPIMRSIKVAEERLLRTQETKAYLGAEGDMRYAELLAEVAFGTELASDPLLVGVQTPGGTGALRLGAELIARARPGATIWIGAPTWPNHAPIFREAGLTTVSHAYYDVARSEILFDAMISALAAAKPGDVVLLHGCCHNPSGAELSAEQWRAVAALCLEKGLIPFVDIAYQGLGGGLVEDSAGLRHIMRAVPETLIAYSCDKNFALYRERVGALWVTTASDSARSVVRDNMLVLARCFWSMPPDHGAALVRAILDDDALRADWSNELDAMRNRLNGLRSALGAAHPALAPIARQRGLFALLPITREAVIVLREKDAVYMAESARINIAGLGNETIGRFVEALQPHLPAA